MGNYDDSYSALEAVSIALGFFNEPYIESMTALFGVFVTQASMVFHCSGKAGVSVTPYGFLVPSFGVVCVLLTISPCVAGLY